jgi:NADH-quinone oxidoreductase subunit H
MKFAGFFLAEYANMIVASAMIVTLYLGGYHLPFINIDAWGLPAALVVIIQIASFLLKMALLLFFFIWVRWSIPRFRYDQLMNLGWKVMFPLSLLNILWVAGLIMIFGL